MRRVACILGAVLLVAAPASAALITRQATTATYKLILTVGPVEKMYTADEMFMVGTAAHVTPIVEVDHRAVGDGVAGPITKQLQTLYYEVIRGKQRAALEEHHEQSQGAFLCRERHGK